MLIHLVIATCHMKLIGSFKSHYVRLYDWKFLSGIQKRGFWHTTGRIKSVVSIDLMWVVSSSRCAVYHIHMISNVLRSIILNILNQDTKNAIGSSFLGISENLASELNKNALCVSSAKGQSFLVHCNDVIISSMASQITSLTIVYSSVYSGADQRKHQSSCSLAFVRGIHRWPVNSPHKGPVTRKMFPFDDVITTHLFVG